jgi:hypothetical protein
MALAPVRVCRDGWHRHQGRCRRRGRLVLADAWWPIPVGLGKVTRGEHIDVLPGPGALW